MDAKQFFYDFGRTLYHIDAAYDDFAKSSGVVSPTLLWILYALNDGGEHTQREICLDWALPKSTVNTVMTELKKDGYVELEPIRGKRREMTIVLTESGKERADALLAAIYAKEEEVYKRLNVNEKKVIQYLAKVAELLKQEMPDENTGRSITMKKTLIAYFSASGSTARLARTIAEVTGGDLFEIIPAQPYTPADLNWQDKNSRSSVEMNNPASRPAIAGAVEKMEKYDTVFVGFPIWWYVAPTIINTFLESYDFSGKTVVTFCTSGSSANNDSNIKSLVCGVNWITGTRLSSSASKSDVADWIDGLSPDVTVK